MDPSASEYPPKHFQQESVRTASDREIASITAAGGKTVAHVAKVEVVTKEIITTRCNYVVALVCDSSGSMEGEPEAAVRAGINTVLAALNDDDYIMMVSFAGSVKVIQTPIKKSELQKTFSSSTMDLGARLPASNGGTALHDAIVKSVSKLAKFHISGDQDLTKTYQYILLTLTDGEDNSSQNKEDDCLLRCFKNPGLPKDFFKFLFSPVNMSSDSEKRYREIAKKAPVGTVSFLKDGDGISAAEIIRKSFEHVLSLVAESRRTTQLQGETNTQLYRLTQKFMSGLLSFRNEDEDGPI